MFSLKDFVMDTIRGMVGNLPDYQVMEYALGWYNRGTINETDLAEIQALIEAKNAQAEEPVTEQEVLDDETTA